MCYVTLIRTKEQRNAGFPFPARLPLRFVSGVDDDEVCVVIPFTTGR